MGIARAFDGFGRGIRMNGLHRKAVMTSNCWVVGVLLNGILPVR